MRKPRIIVKVVKHPSPTRFVKWACMDTRDKSVISGHYYRKNAISAAALANSILRKYGSL